jgi:hypothetical protein
MFDFRRAFGVCVAIGMVAGCGGAQTQPSQAFCPVMVPFVQLLYPIPKTKGVSPNVGQMIFAATGVGRIHLVIGSYPYSGRVRTKPEPLPSPLPTPIATPGPYAQYLTTRFAVSFKALKAHTRYGAQAWEVYNPCAGGVSVSPGWAALGSFSTQ